MVPKLRPLMDRLEAAGMPQDCYISLDDWQTLQPFVKTHTDEQGLFFWLLTTKVRVKASHSSLDLTTERLYPRVVRPRMDLDAETG